MYQLTKDMQACFSDDLQVMRTGTMEEVIELKGKWEALKESAFTPTQKEYCRRAIKAAQIALVGHKYKIYKKRTKRA